MGKLLVVNAKPTAFAIQAHRPENPATINLSDQLALIINRQRQQSMRTTIVFAVIAVASLLGCSAKRDASETSPLNAEGWLKAEQKRVAQFQVVAYATVDTNNAPDIVLIVSEVWKGHQEARTLGVTNGMPFSMRWPDDAGFLPDCAIIYIPRTLDRAKPFLGGGALFPKNGGVYTGVTIQQYKTGLGF